MIKRGKHNIKILLKYLEEKIPTHIYCYSDEIAYTCPYQLSVDEHNKIFEEVSEEKMPPCPTYCMLVQDFVMDRCKICGINDDFPESWKKEMLDD